MEDHTRITESMTTPSVMKARLLPPVPLEVNAVVAVLSLPGLDAILADTTAVSLRRRQTSAGVSTGEISTIVKHIAYLVSVS